MNEGSILIVYICMYMSVTLAGFQPAAQGLAMQTAHDFNLEDPGTSIWAFRACQARAATKLSSKCSWYLCISAPHSTHTTLVSMWPGQTLACCESYIFLVTCLVWYDAFNKDCWYSNSGCWYSNPDSTYQHTESKSHWQQTVGRRTHCPNSNLEWWEG